MEKGCYVLNWVACHGCGETDPPVAIEREASGDGVAAAETVTYKHACVKCQHVVASHSYTFEVQGDFQCFEMECGLCGYAQHEASIEPFDPRLAPDPLF